MNEERFKAPISPVRSRWPKMMVGKPLTDRQIEKYQKQGYYSTEFRNARRELMKSKKVGGFREVEGRLIYSP